MTATLTLHEDPTTLDADAWNALLAACPAPTPFLRHEFLAALHTSGSAVTRTGWQPVFLTLADPDGTLQAAAALYLKSHSYGEYVFDWAWADAWQRAGQRYYPKLLGAVPFTPVPGSRLLARSDAARATLLQAIETFARDQGLSSAHLLFLDEADRAAAQAQGWLLREGVQFHWSNRTPEPYADFADFLASLTRDKRKKMQQERRYVREAGVTFEALHGAAIGEDDWDYFYRCYDTTYREHHSTPYLTRAFWAEVARTMPAHWLLFIARRGGERIAASLVALDPAQRVAYGRYWGCTESVPHLHFAACYHEPLDWCVREGFARFEGGAQGEHKMARGLLPVKTTSAHWLRHPGFADAVARFLDEETAGIGAYVDELRGRNPFKGEP
ncbi:GNAT family N-acetyltransferase [Sphaerotilus sp.]|uniref:GNAT family N-acetyltransferase n=1 Tax=Sphaerotilus sp. TaxID=2093942 RepID=UPI002ACEE4C5|nr:GNAT family N-acetyltransferase [Sphaerotilus sp.]MDZ7858354.1 GNAT family N-acetyltransferase [Sphaerotilus sp.]